MSELHVYSRAKWGARSARAGEGTQDTPIEAFLHHSADPDGRAFNTLAKQAAHMRGVQDYHMDDPAHGWNDIGYHFVVFQYVGTNHRREPRVFAGRPTNIVPAAQLGHNTRTLAICVAGNGDAETLTHESRVMIARLINKYGPRVTILRPHSANPAHPGQTDCPGDHFRAAVPEIATLAKVRH